jgi:DNA end-binding protein Ku
MSARPIASATVSFGLVSVPVKLYSTADNSQKVTFNWINPSSNSRVRQRYWDPKEERIVDREELVKGYEFAREQYVLFTPDELKVLEAQSSNAIEIAEFIPFEHVERMYLAKAYFLGPDRGGERAYRLLSAALRETGRAALARYATRGKEYLVLVRPLGEGLVLEQLYYAQELKSFDEVPIGEADVKDEELALAVQLVNQAASEGFEPQRYEDEVSAKVLALIEKKIEGEEITAAPEVEASDKIVDLMEALKASLGAPAESADAEDRKPARRANSRGKGGTGKRAAK